MYRRKKDVLGKSWGIKLSLMLLLCSPLVSFEKNNDPERDSWINLLGESPMDLPTQVSNLDDLIELSISRNSGIRAQYAAWRSNQEAEGTVTNLPDPILGLGYFVEPVETAQGPQSAKISLGQTIPWRSKIRAASATRGYMSLQSYKTLETDRLVMVREINHLWAEASHIQSKTSIIEAKLALSSDLEEVLNIQYQSASLSHKRLVEVQIQTLQLENNLQDVASQNYRLRAKLGSILELEGPVPANFLPSHVNAPSNDFSSGAVSREHPRLEGLEAMIQEAQARKASARAAYIPDLKIGLDYILTDRKIAGGEEVAGSGKDLLMVSAGIALPLWNWKSKKLK